jgi:hypothetical protein
LFLGSTALGHAVSALGAAALGLERFDALARKRRLR